MSPEGQPGKGGLATILEVLNRLTKSGAASGPDQGIDLLYDLLAPKAKKRRKFGKLRGSKIINLNNYRKK